MRFGQPRISAVAHGLGSGLTLLALLALASGGCESRRARRPHGQRPAATRPPEELPPDDPPVPPVLPAPPPRAAPPAPPRPAPAPHPRAAAAKDDRLGACGGGAGPRLAVHGVADDDTLNVRAEPDAQSDVLGQLSPHATGILSLGQRKRVGSATWEKVKCGSVVGWANGKFLAAPER